MRICYVALGKFLHVDPYLEFFSRRGHDVHFVALAPGPQRAVATYDVGLGPVLGSLCGKAGYLPAMVRARRVVRSLAPDVVHAHYATSAGLSAFLSGFHPWLVTAHGTDVAMGVRSAPRRWLLRRLLADADCVNPVSDGLRQLVAGLGIPKEKIVTLTLGIDVTQFRFTERDFNCDSTPLQLICTRRLEPVYNHETLLRAMALLKNRGIAFHLTLAGEGSRRAGLEHLAAALQLTDRVQFLGEVPNHQLPQHLGRNDVYLSASTRDGTSLCLLEAMACGLYPIVSDIGANREWLDHGRNGLLHPPQEPEALAECITRFARSSMPARAAARHNRRLVLERGDRATNLQHLERVYQRLVHPHNGKSGSRSALYCQANKCNHEPTGDY